MPVTQISKLCLAWIASRASQSHCEGKRDRSNLVSPHDKAWMAGSSPAMTSEGNALSMTEDASAKSFRDGAPAPDPESRDCGFALTRAPECPLRGHFFTSGQSLCDSGFAASSGAIV